MNILTNRIEYAVGDASHQGYLAYDDEITAARPGIVIVHEWWGLNDYIVRRAHMLAELGYFALAIDMYGGGQFASDPGQAGELMNGVLNDMETGTAALRAGHDLLLDQAGVLVGAIGQRAVESRCGQLANQLALQVTLDRHTDCFDGRHVVANVGVVNVGTANIQSHAVISNGCIDHRLGDVLRPRCFFSTAARTPEPGCTADFCRVAPWCFFRRQFSVNTFTSGRIA